MGRRNTFGRLKFMDEIVQSVLENNVRNISDATLWWKKNKQIKHYKKNRKTTEKYTIMEQSNCGRLC